jgi:two-component system response regulator PilR (NtrC family)
MTILPVLVVDDEPDICELIALTLDRLGHKSQTAHTLLEAKEKLTQQRYALCLTDMRLPDGDGLELISFISKACPGTPVAMISAHGNMDTAIEALKRGAFDFLNKPIQLDELKALIQSAITLPASASDDDLKLIQQRLAGNSTAINQLRDTIIKVARSQAPVFIQGESGSGKEVCARTIHDLSSRKKAPFIAVNCGAIPSELVESEFFGHKKGSFTGADKDKMGLFASAHGGTLLLDEVADLPLAMQVKLLRAIQEKSIRPVGSNEEISIDVRILSATHKNLIELVKQGLFRNDLFYRINVIELFVPPLRERKEDIATIAAHILKKISATMQRGVFELSDDAVLKLQGYLFPGNIRELENTLERTIALCDHEYIESQHLIFQLGQPSPQDDSIAPDSIDHQATKHQPNISIINADTAPDPSIRNPPRDGSLDDYLNDIERQEILAALDHCRWNKTETAKNLGISFRSLRYRLKKLDIDE